MRYAPKPPDYPPQSNNRQQRYRCKSAAISPQAATSSEISFGYFPKANFKWELRSDMREREERAGRTTLTLASQFGYV